VQENFIAKLFTKTSQKVVTKSSPKIAQNYCMNYKRQSYQRKNATHMKLSYRNYQKN